MKFIHLIVLLFAVTGVAMTKEKRKVPYMLPEKYYVYAGNDGVVNVPYPGLKKVLLPTVNKYKESPGCYIACYSHDKSRAVYSVGGDIYVMGQVRVKGNYENRICLPEGYESADISALDLFKKICNENISNCSNGGCWAGGDTGGWFGIQEDGSIR